MKKQGQWQRRVALVAGLLLALGLTGETIPFSRHAEAANFATRRLATSESLAGATAVRYTLSFSGQSAGTVGSIRVQICANDPFPGTPCDTPVGLDLSNANLLNQDGMTGFSIHSATNTNELVLTRSPGSTTTGLATYEFDNITNPTNAGSYYVRLETFASQDASGPSHDASGLAVEFGSDDLSIQTYVPPYLAFCIGNDIPTEDCAAAEGNYVDLGELSATKTATAQTKLLVATNADFGYSLTFLGTTLTSGINVIPAMSSPDVSRPGTSQFGLNLRANTTPPAGSEPAGMGRGVPASGYNIPNQFKFSSGDVLASYSGADYYRMYTATYVVNVSKDQPSGVYVTTLTYIALATF